MEWNVGTPSDTSCYGELRNYGKCIGLYSDLVSNSKLLNFGLDIQKPNYELIKISIGALDQPTLVWTTIEWVLKISFRLVNYI